MWIGILAAMYLLPSLFASVVIYSLIIWQFGIKTSLRAGILRRHLLRSDYALCRACHSTLAASHGNTVCTKRGKTCDIEATKHAWNSRRIGKRTSRNLAGARDQKSEQAIHG